MNHKKTFGVVVDDKELELAVVRPSFEIQHQAGLVRSKAFADAVKAGAILRIELDDIMKKRNLWDDSKQRELDRLNNEIDELTLKLKKGGIKLSEGKTTALELKKLRDQRQDLLSDRISLDTSTAEGRAENESLSYVISRCIVYNSNGEPYFKTYEDYLENRSSEVARKGFSTYIELISDVSVDFDNDLPENKFLRLYKFIDDKGRFIDKDGHLVDIDGRLVDEKGRLINKDGQLIDRNGTLVDEDGNYLVETKPFLDEDGNPV